MAASLEPKVSVVIPVYAVEAYIGQCARSLFSQTWDNCEFISWTTVLLTTPYLFWKGYSPRSSRDCNPV